MDSSMCGRLGQFFGENQTILKKELSHDCVARLQMAGHTHGGVGWGRIGVGVGWGRVGWERGGWGRVGVRGYRVW